MPITIEINAKQLDSNAPLKMHYLPAKIDGDGQANVETYFDNYTSGSEHGHLTNALRGFPLLGEEQTVPKGYKALVLQETRKPLDEEADRRLRVTGTFDKFHYWNYDKIPTKADNYRQALQTLSVAEELAKPVTEEEVQQEIERHQQKENKESP